MALKVNEEGVRNAKKLIESGKIDVTGKWGELQPSAQEQDEFLKKSDWNTYGKWFLAINPDKPKNEKQYYEFPFGDFTKVSREGLIAVKQRASQYKHTEIEKAADQLLQLIEKKEGSHRR